MFSPEEFLAGKFLLIDKPLTWTSHDVVNKIRYRLTRYCGVKKIKVGHSGTLDPLATGLLIIATGGFTKKLDPVIASEKEYTGTFYIGGSTASHDAETPVDATFPTSHITEALIKETAKKFTGKLQQFPPIHSAVKIAGKPLYVNARKGMEIKTEARDIEIYSFEITAIALPSIHFRVECS
ncbi:MAG: tRNA pseudouridine(55) synthase, partial [Chitinophagales bacterium]